LFPFLPSSLERKSIVDANLRRNTDGYAGDLALEGWQDGGNGFGGAGGCGDDVVEDASS
jgi:hypothetical protein